LLRSSAGGLSPPTDANLDFRQKDEFLTPNGDLTAKMVN
jgi:hypothetical protein